MAVTDEQLGTLIAEAEATAEKAQRLGLSLWRRAQKNLAELLQVRELREAARRERPARPTARPTRRPTHPGCPHGARRVKPSGEVERTD